MLESAPNFARRLVRDGRARQRQDPQDDGAGRHGEGGARGEAADDVAPVEGGARDDEAGERKQEKDRVGGVDERKRQACAHDCGQERPARCLHVREDERERRWHEQLARGGRRQVEHAVRAAVPGRQGDQRHLREGGRNARAGRAKERVPRLVGEEQRKRHEHAGLVQDGKRGVDSGEPRHRRQEAVPEREGVPRMQPAVPELVERPQRERAERLELPDASEVEEPVPLHLAGDVPQRDAERGADEEDGEPHCARPSRLDAHRRHERGERDDPEPHKRQPERAVDEERDGEREREGAERERKRGRRATQRERTSGERPGHEDDGGRRRETQVEAGSLGRESACDGERRERQQDRREAPHRPVRSSAAAELDASHPAASR